MRNFKHVSEVETECGTLRIEARGTEKGTVIVVLRDFEGEFQLSVPGVSGFRKFIRTLEVGRLLRFSESLV